MKTVCMSDEYPCFCRSLEAFGYRIIPTENITLFHPPERRHADMQLLVIKDRVFTLRDCQRLGKNYPDNVRLNCLLLGDCLYGRLDAVEPSVLDFCRNNGIDTVNVRQGYTRCSVLAVDDSAAITADRTIAKALTEHGAEVQLISPGGIRLEGFDCGFVGGASFVDENRVFFFGNAAKHPDFEAIRVFCEKHHFKIELLNREEPLTDVGGAVRL